MDFLRLNQQWNSQNSILTARQKFRRAVNGVRWVFRLRKSQLSRDVNNATYYVEVSLDTGKLIKSPVLPSCKHQYVTVHSESLSLASLKTEPDTRENKRYRETESDESLHLSKKVAVVSEKVNFVEAADNDAPVSLVPVSHVTTTFCSV